MKASVMDDLVLNVCVCEVWMDGWMDWLREINNAMVLECINIYTRSSSRDSVLLGHEGAPYSSMHRFSNALVMLPVTEINA